jgi:WD40 repeat protein
MSDSTNPSSRERRLELVLAEYLQAREAGRTPDKAELLRRHPDLAGDLTAFFANQAELCRLGEALGRPTPPTSDVATVGLTDTTLNEEGLLRLGSFGDYEIVEEIARGGMGVVFRARQVSLGRPVAIKMILAGQLASEADQQRFRTEAQAAANLDHPNIVAIYEVGEHQGQPYFSMPLVEGGSLTRWIERCGPHGAATPQHQAEAARLLAAVARAVHHAHQHRILHRDLKPANILLDGHGEPHVTDFGLAKRVEGDSKVTQTGSIVGTPSYMAPEQAAGRKDLTTAADVWSLGAVLYEMLTGRPPFRGGNPLETLLDVLGKDPAPPRSLNPAVDGDLATIALKCLDKDSARRYGSAEALAEDLERFLAGEPIHARPAGSLERAAKWARRRPAIACLSTAVVLVSALGVAGITQQWHQAVAAGQEARNAEEVASERADAANRERVKAERARDETGKALVREKKALDGALTATRKATEAARQESQAKQKEAAARIREAEQRRKAEDERDAKQRALVRAEGLRLNAEAAAARHGDPALALLLALEAVERAPHRLTFATLHDALRDCRELRTLYGTSAPLRCTPDGSLLVGPVGSWDEKGKLVARTVQWRAPTNWLDLSPDGRRAVSLMNGDQHVYYTDGKEPARHVFTERVAYIWDTRTGKDVLHLRKHRDHVVSARFSPDGKHVVTASWDNTAILWDAGTGKKLHEYRGHQCALHDALFSPDGRRVLTVTSGRSTTGRGAQFSEAEAKRPNLPEGRERDPGVVDRPGRSGQGGSVRFSMTLLGESPVARLWDARTGRQLAGLRKSGEGGGIRLSFNPLGVAASYAPGWVSLLDWATGKRFEKWASSPANNVTLPHALAAHLPWLAGHPGHPTAAAFSPDGRRVAIAFEERVACVWDLPRGGWPRLEQRGHTGAVRVLAFSPDGRRLATAGDDRAVRVLDLASGKAALTLWGHEGTVTLVRFSPDGKRILSGSADGTVRLWDAVSGEQKAALRGHGKEITSAELHPDGRRIVTTGGDGTARLWDVEPPREVAHVLRGHTGKINSLAFSPDGKRLLTAADDETPRLWDPSTGREVLRLGEGKKLGAIRSARFSGDGTKVVTASQNTYVAEGNILNPSAVHVWDSRTGADLLALKDHRHAALDARFSKDDRVLLTISDGNIHVKFDAGFKGGVDRTASGAAGLARLWDANSGKLLATVEQTETKTMFRWSGQQLYARLAPDGRLVLHKPYDGDAFLLADAVTGKTKARLLHDRERWGSAFYFAAFSPDSRLVFTAVGGRDARVWDVQSARPVLLIQDLSGFASGTFSPDGRRLALVGSKIVYIWDLQTRLRLATLQGHEAGVVRAVFSRDGKLIVTGGRDNQALLWDASTGKTLALFSGHTGAVTHVAFSPDGRSVATGSEDGTVRVWPADLVSAARGRLPRQLTAQERERYAVAAGNAVAPEAQIAAPTVLPPPGKTAQPLLSGPRRLAAAEEATANRRLAHLRKQAGEAAAREGLIALRRDYPGTAQALEAAALLTKLPSPLDALDASKVPAEERLADHPKELVAVLGQQRWRHAKPVKSVHVSPDGRLIASGDEREVRLWDARTGERRGVVAGMLLGFVTGPGRLVTFSDNHLRFWDVSGRGPRQERAIAHKGSPRALSPDGSTLAEVTDSFGIRLWDVRPDKLLPRATLAGHGRRFPRILFSGDGRTLASWADGDVARLWDLQAPTPRQIVVLPGLARWNNALAVSADGKRVALTAPEGTRLWDLTGTKPLMRGVVKELRDGVGSLAFSPNGKVLAAGGGRRAADLSLWNVTGPEAKKILSLPGHSGWLHGVAFSPDDSFLVSGGADCTVRVWDLTATSGRPRFALRGHAGPVTGLAFAPDRPLLVSNSDDGTARLWDLFGGTVREAAVLPGGWGRVAFSPDGGSLAVAHGRWWRLWDVRGNSPRERAVLQGHSYGSIDLAFAADGKSLLTGSGGPVLRLWDLSTAKPREAALLPEGKQGQSITSVSLAPDGRLVAAGTEWGERVMQLWRRTGKGFEPVRMQRVEARLVLFSPDGKTLAVTDDGWDISLWDLGSPVPMRRAVLRGHQLPGWSGILRSFAFSPDGSRLASTAQDRRLIVWSTAGGELLRQWQLPVEPSHVAFAPDGRHVATGNSNGTIYLFRVGK